MKYSYNESRHEAWISEYVCTNYFCEPDCECGLDFEEAKQMVISHYRYLVEKAEQLSEEDWIV